MGPCCSPRRRGTPARLGELSRRGVDHRGDGMTALALMSITFVLFFFFASVYAQVSLGKSSSSAGEHLAVAT